MDRVKASLKKLKLDRFYGNISRLMAVWFEGEQPDDLSEYLTEFIFASGSWGNVEQREAAQAVRNMRRAGSETGGKLRYLVRVVFPNLGAMQKGYPVLIKAPWLLPVMWLVRILRRLFFGRSSKKRYKRILNAMNQETLDTRQQLLRYVGLDPHQGL